MADFVERLKLLIPLLGSDQDGEVLAAVAAIRRHLAAHKKDWHALAAMLTVQEPRIIVREIFRTHVPPVSPFFSASGRASSKRKLSKNDRIHALLNHPGDLSAWEKEFLKSLLAATYPVLTAKQATTLGQIEAKIAEIRRQTG